MANKCVVRNQSYSRGNASNIERHNERKNAYSGNVDIVPQRQSYNVHFKECSGSYLDAFNQMVADGIISTRGQRKDAKILDEFVFDVNSGYFEERGGYEYAKQFYEEAYRMAVKEAGGEQYIVSAVMHADERNKALSEQLGHDAYHYHLHVVYVPVVDKEIKWTKRCKDPSLVGTVKEVIKQVSHSKKWASEKGRDEDGITILRPSYSLLQDRYFEHMRDAGYTDIERGERGSTTAHLNTLDYKIQQNKARAAVLEKELCEEEKALASLQKKVKITEQSIRDIDAIRDLRKRTGKDKVVLTVENWKKVFALAQNGILYRAENNDLQRKVDSIARNKEIYKDRWQTLAADTKLYTEAQRLAPQQTQLALESVMREAQSLSSGRSRQRNLSGLER